MRGGDTSLDRPARGGDNGGDSNFVGGDTENVAKITHFLDNIQKFSSILGKIWSNDGKLVYFLENGVKNRNFWRKIEIFGASRRHISGSEHFEGGDPPPQKFFRRFAPALEGGDPPPLF